MRMPVLQLVEYVFPEIECRENPDCPRNPDAVCPPEVQVNPRMAVKEDDDDAIYRLALEIRFGSEGEHCSYIGRVKVVGIFSVASEVEEKEKQVYINGASILYSAAREFVLSITSRGPSFPLMLPTVRFNTCEHEEDFASQDQARPD